MAASSVNKIADGSVIGALVRAVNELIMVLNMKKISAVLVFLILTSTAFAQSRTFKWAADMCEFTLTYDSKKYSEIELRNTARLFEYGQFNLTYHPMVFKYEDIAKLDVAALDKEYAAKSAKLKSLKIVKSPFWETVRQRKIKEMDQAYRFRRIQTLAYDDPKVLREYTAAPSCNLKYAEALISSGESLFKVWLDVNLEGRARNCCPNEVKAKFEQQLASPDREKFAMVEVMAFGWGNCANALIEYDERGNDGTYLKEYKKLFVRVRESCEEP